MTQFGLGPIPRIAPSKHLRAKFIRSAGAGFNAFRDIRSQTRRSDMSRSIQDMTALTRARCLRSGWTINHISRERMGLAPLKRQSSGTRSAMRQGSNERPKPARTALRANSESLTMTYVRDSGSDAIALVIQRACGKLDHVAS